MWQNKADEILGKNRKSISEEKDNNNNNNNLVKEDDNTTIQKGKEKRTGGKANGSANQRVM